MDPIYLDHAATTPLRPEVRDAMAPYQDARFGNASSLHRWGREASAALEGARATVAEALGVSPAEVYFVRGGTESDNLAVVGGWRARRAAGATPRVIVSAIEHSAVLDAARALAEDEGADVHLVDVSPAGTLDLAALERLLADGPSLVSVMGVNNETGLRLPVDAVGALVHEHGGVMHCDAAQTVGKVPLPLRDLDVDLLTATGHKINGPKGTGILVVRGGAAVRPLVRGGGQERGLRPGTEDVAGAVGFATALALAVAEQPDTARSLGTLRATFEDAVRASLPSVRVNCADADRSPHVSSLGVPVSDGAALLMALDLEGVAVSGGSACHSGSDAGSHVIRALYGADDPYATVRFSFGHGSTTADALRAAATLSRVVERFEPMPTAASGAGGAT